MHRMPEKTRLRNRIIAFAALLLALGGCSYFTFNAVMCDRVISDPNTQNIPLECRPYREEDAAKASLPPKEQEECEGCSGGKLEYRP
jgi:hypothetical protein